MKPAKKRSVHQWMWSFVLYSPPGRWSLFGTRHIQHTLSFLCTLSLCRMHTQHTHTHTHTCTHACTHTHTHTHTQTGTPYTHTHTNAACIPTQTHFHPTPSHFPFLLLIPPVLPAVPPTPQPRPPAPLRQGSVLPHPLLLHEEGPSSNAAAW